MSAIYRQQRVGHI